jgi:Zn ribbon nucleic-acid-binding protein
MRLSSQGLKRRDELMARCPDCNKFVGVELGDGEDVDNLEIVCSGIEADSEDIEENVDLSGEVRLVLNCLECGTELKEATVQLEETIQFTHLIKGCQGEVEIDQNDIQTTDRFEGKGRGAKHFYGVEVTVSLDCPECKASQSHTLLIEEQASNFEDC